MKKKTEHNKTKQNQIDECRLKSSKANILIFKAECQKVYHETAQASIAFSTLILDGMHNKSFIKCFMKDTIKRLFHKSMLISKQKIVKYNK